MKKEFCERCLYEHNVDKIYYVEEAYFCHDCNDTHAGYVCKNCLYNEDIIIRKGPFVKQKG